MDDSGSRDPDKSDFIDREDEMDYFGLGGILVKEEDILEILNKHREFFSKWKLKYPLHSSSIRDGREKLLISLDDRGSRRGPGRLCSQSPVIRKAIKALIPDHEMIQEGDA